MNNFRTSLLLKKAIQTQKNSIVLSSTSAEATLKKPKFKVVTPGGWFLLVVPASTFALGVWQVQRKTWKEGLIKELQERTNADPVPLPDSLEEIKQLEYKPVYVKGKFLNEKEMYLGPRSLLNAGEASTRSSWMSKGNQNNQGYQIVTPFKLEDRDETILINRGWVPMKLKDARYRQEGQIEGTTNVVGLVRVNEPRPNFSIKNQEGSNLYFYRDLPTMAKAAGTSEIFLDATKDFDVPGGPVGGQTMVSLRNEHLSYILTWFSLSGATAYMWYKMCFKK